MNEILKMAAKSGAAFERQKIEHGLNSCLDRRDIGRFLATRDLEHGSTVEMLGDHQILISYDGETAGIWIIVDEMIRETPDFTFNLEEIETIQKIQKIEDRVSAILRGETT